MVITQAPTPICHAVDEDDGAGDDGGDNDEGLVLIRMRKYI